MEIKEIINSGILETYVMGIATEQEIEQVLYYKKQYPEFKAALLEVELDLERLALSNSIQPPAGTLQKIEEQINELQLREKALRKPIDYEQPKYEAKEPRNAYIEVESVSNHMKIHKAWRWVFAAVFVLGKIFLGFAIYYYLENRQAQLQINELKQEIKQIKTP